MKTIIAASIFHLLISFYASANGGLTPERHQAKMNEKSNSDEVYLDELKTRESALQRRDRTKKKMEENPRNGAMVESFGQINSKEDEQEKQEEKKE